MRFATYEADGQVLVGVVQDDHVHSLPPALDMHDVIAMGLAQAREVGQRAMARTPGRPLSQVRLLPPLVPASVRDFVAFEEHVEGVRRSIDGVSGVAEAWYDAPTFYFTNPHAILATGDDVQFPVASEAKDFELEVAAVLGSGGRSLTIEEAKDAIFGYVIFNDWSARDLQRREMQVGLGPAKGKDFASTLGPWIVTPDELEPYRDADGFLNLWCEVSVNGDVVGRDLLSNMGWTFEAMIAYASRDSLVVPGDVLASGTTGNGGCLAELWGRRGQQTPPPLATGDVVRLTVQGIGSISNTVSVSKPAPDLPAARRRSFDEARSAHA